MERKEYFDGAWDKYDITDRDTTNKSRKEWAQEEIVTSQEASFTPFEAMSSGSASPLILIGLEAICNAVGAGPRTVKRWVDVDGFPARRCSDGVYRADPHSVQRWFSSN